MAKLVLRFTNFSCSLIVLAMLGTVLTIFNASLSLPARNTLPAWNPGTPIWPQITVLAIACVSLTASVIILIAYTRKGHKRADKLAAYYSMMAIGFFIFSIIMWATGAGILQHQKNNGNGKDMWGWSCKSNVREKVFGSDIGGQSPINYKLLCRLQNWSLVCAIIEVVVEVITILVYAVVFYRYWSKRKLNRTMARRDTARSNLYMGQLKSPGGTNFPTSPGLNGPASPRDGGYNPMYSPRFASGNKDDVAERGQAAGAQFSSLNGALAPVPGNFTLSKPPMKSPKSGSKPTFAEATSPVSPTPLEALQQAQQQKVHEHVEAAPGERQYGAVPIPGAYASPITSPLQGPPGGFQEMR